MSFEIHCNDNKISLKGGMSSEICFAKYLAHKSKKVYSGWTPKRIVCSDNVIEETLNQIVKAVKQDSIIEKMALICPGILTVPYITELMNILYLPSQLLIPVNSIEKLKNILKNANEKNIKCYAEVGYDACMPECLVAWVKLLEIPKQYLDLFTYLGTKTVMTIGVNTIGKAGLGENISRSYSETNDNAVDKISPRSIYFIYINEGYGQEKKVDENFFTKLVPDLNLEYIKQERVHYIYDWESGITNPYNLLEPFSGKKIIFCARDTLNLYDLSFKLSEEFIKLNGIKKKGFVFNPYFVNNPLYEAYYGYVAYSFWQFSKNIYSHFLDLLGDYGWENTNWQSVAPYRHLGELWANTDKEDILSNLTINITMTNDTERAEFIQKHRPSKYPELSYLNILDLIRICKERDIFTYSSM